MRGVGMFEKVLDDYDVVDEIENVSEEILPEDFFLDHKLSKGLLEISSIKGSEYGRNYDVIFFDTFMCVDITIDSDRKLILLSNVNTDDSLPFLQGQITFYGNALLLDSTRGNEKKFLNDLENMFFPEEFIQKDNNSLVKKIFGFFSR
jgi:hypothetical protein